MEIGVSGTSLGLQHCTILVVSGNIAVFCLRLKSQVAKEAPECRFWRESFDVNPSGVGSTRLVDAATAATAATASLTASESADTLTGSVFFNSELPTGGSGVIKSL